jgi:hypothetical protein
MSAEQPTAIADFHFTVEYDPTVANPSAIAYLVNEWFDDVLRSDSTWPDRMVSAEHGSPGVGVVAGHRRPDDLWAEDPKHPRSDWRYEVNNEDTLLGYWDWVRSMKEAADAGKS